MNTSTGHTHPIEITAEDFRKYLRLSLEDINNDKELHGRFWDALYDIEHCGATFTEVALFYGLD